MSAVLLLWEVTSATFISPSPLCKKEEFKVLLSGAVELPARSLWTCLGGGMSMRVYVLDIEVKQGVSFERPSQCNSHHVEAGRAMLMFD